MGWLRAFIGAPWLPYAVIGAAVWTAGVSGYAYFKGYSSAEETYFVEMNKALANQLKDLLSQKELEIKLALQAEQRKHNVSKKVAAVPKPTVGCELPVQCVQWYDNILRASATSRPSTD